MSEEILKALMQLFAIIAKQDEGVAIEEREFVKVFLRQQLDKDSVQEYLALFDSFSETSLSKNKKKHKLTPVIDSVRTLGICKKINKTLTQKQKVVVLVRLFELVTANRQFTPQRIELIEMVADSFYIKKDEENCIKSFVTANDPTTFDNPDIIIINEEENITCEYCKHIISEQLNGSLVILKIKSVDLYFLRYTGISDIFLNGLAINNKHIYLFANGSTIRVPSGKPVYYSDITAHFLADITSFRVSFNVKNIEYKFPNGNTGLRDISISEKEGKLMGIMGASGAGKTTLLNVLCGIGKPTRGGVFINGINIHTEREKIEGVIGYIPQDDLLIEELTVYENLYYNAKLCFKDLSNEEIDNLVVKVLTSLGLLEIKHLKVGNPLNKEISGGQRKRLNIGLELTREPSVMFVDEPTSGLSSRDSENVMDLLRELTLNGKLIFVVIHQPSSDIYKMFDKIIFLDAGGYLIYYGNPVEAIMYFKKIDKQVKSDVGECSVCGSANPETIFNVVEAKVVDEFGCFTDKRKISPGQWAELYEKNFAQISYGQVKEALPKILSIPPWIKQVKIFFTRDLFSKLSNMQYLLINLLEAPALAFMLAFIIRYIEKSNSNIYIYRENENIPSYIFMCIIVVLFLGLTVSAEEIFKDRKILKREAFLNLSRSGYLFSKIAILFLLSAIQTITFVVIGNSILGINSMYIDYWAVLFSASCLANMMGLNISATFNSAVTIYIIIPLLLIPQMILGGALFSFDKLNRAIGGGHQVPFIAEIMPARWAYEALMVNQFVNNKFEEYFYDIEKQESICDYRQVYYIPELIDMVDECKDNMIIITDKNNPLFSKTKDNLSLLKNEISKELQNVESIKFNHLESLNIESFNDAVGDSTKEYLELLRNYYGLKFNSVNLRKEYMIMEMTGTGSKKPEQDENRSQHVREGNLYKTLRNSFHNDHLSDVVKKKFNKNKTAVRKHRLIQLFDPIYLDPDDSGFFNFRTHFFAPVKYFIGNYISTYSFNLAAIWVMTIILYVTLYYESFNKTLTTLGRIASRRK